MERNAPNLVSIIHGLPDGGNGDYGNPEWKSINMEMSRRAREIIKDGIEHEETIGFIDVDVVFLRPAEWTCLAAWDDLTVPLAMRGADIAFQHERNELFNPGVSFWSCSPRTLAGFDRWLERLNHWDGHLSCQNGLMLESFWPDCQIGILPNTFANPSNGGDLARAVLFHANNTPPPNSVEQKLRMMQVALKSL